MSRVLVESEIDWIGKIPDNWNIQPLGLYLKERKEKVSDIDYEPLSVTKNGVVPQLENAAKSDAHDQRKKVCKFDFVINSRSDRKQSCGLSYLEGSVSLINTVLKIYNYYPEYIKYALDNNMFSEEFYRNGHGIVADLWTTKYSEMKHIRIPEPKYDEQVKIANYLNNQCKKIDKIIEDNNREIELLEEYKRRIIFEKTSLGTITKVKNIGYVNGRIGFKGYSNEDIVDEDTPGRALSIGGTNIMKSGTLSYDKRTYISEEKYLESPEIMLTGGEILMTKVGAGCGENSIYEFYEERVTINPNVMILHVNDNVNSKYINYCLLNDEVRSNIKIESMSGGAQPAINQELLKNLKIKLPSKSEQDNNTDFLDKQCSKLDSVVEYRKQIIEKLEEYKRSLIYECVTGKREV